MVDDQIFLGVLNSRFGSKGTALSWFSSYLEECQFYVSIHNHHSNLRTLLHGVPQGSCAGPTAVTMYSSTLETVVHMIQENDGSDFTDSINLALQMITHSTKPSVQIPMKLNETQLESWNTSYMTLVTGWL